MLSARKHVKRCQSLIESLLVRQHSRRKPCTVNVQHCNRIHTHINTLLMDYCDVFISCLKLHSDGTNSLQMIHWWVIDVMLNFFQICSDEETKSTSWMARWVHFLLFFFIFESLLKILSKGIFNFQKKSSYQSCIYLIKMIVKQQYLYNLKYLHFKHTGPVMLKLNV